jgi:sulfoxide reductase heme-binding subunit YedZ
MTFGGLGSNPIEALHLYTGLWSLRFLCVTLMVTPLQTLGRWRGAAPFRQLFGLTSFAYAALHLLGYLILDHGLLWDVIAQDILETPHIWPGLFGFSILLLLALTSPKYGKKLMGKNWKRLHRWIYIAAPLVIIHYAMQLKGNLADPLLYGLLILVLLGFRAGIWIRNRQVARLMIPNTPRLGNDPDDPEAPVPLRRAATKVR